MRTLLVRSCLLVLILVGIVPLAISSPAAADACTRQLCSGSLPIYAGRDGVGRDGVPYGVCRNDPGFLGPRAHSMVPCPAGTTLVALAGLCRVNSCDGGGCSYRGVCANYPGFPYYRSDGRPGEATCSNEPPPILNYRAHTIARCPSGWSLIPGTGICRQCASATPAPRPDLVFRSVWLSVGMPPVRVTSVRRGRPYQACFVVANAGAAASGPFRVSGGGLGIPTTPFQDHAGLAAGLSRTGCIDYPTTPPAGSYGLGLTVDSLGAVTESREFNNTATIPVTVVP